MEPWHWLDLVIVALVAWLTLQALSIGLIRQVVTCVSVIGGAILAGHFHAELADDIAFAIEDETWREFVAFAAIFAGAVVIGQIAAAQLRRTARMLLLGPADRVGGALVGFLTGVVVVEALLLAAVAFPISGHIDAALEDSALAPVFLETLPLVQNVLPGEFAQAAEAWADGLPLPDSLPNSLPDSLPNSR